MQSLVRFQPNKGALVNLVNIDKMAQAGLGWG
jgi:hypothetical protein